MSREGDQGPEVPGEAAEDIDTGEPIHLLADLRRPPSAGFVERLRRSIERRRLGSDLLELGWQGPFLVLFEWIKALFQPTSRQGDRRQQPADENSPQDD